MPDEERRVADLDGIWSPGRLADLVPGSYRVILGKALAETLGAHVGDRVVLMVPQGDVTPDRRAASDARIPRSTASCPSACTSTTGASRSWRCRMPRRLLHMGDDITGHAPQPRPICTPRRASCATLRSRSEGGEAYLVNDWTEQHVNFFRSIEITKHMLFVILSLMVAVAAFNIVSTMVMVVKDKRRDIAILRTFGSSPRSILSVFIVQGSLIGGLGIAGGLLVGVLIAVNLQRLVHGLGAPSSASNSSMRGCIS